MAMWPCIDQLHHPWALLSMAMWPCIDQLHHQVLLKGVNQNLVTRRGAGCEVGAVVRKSINCGVLRKRRKAFSQLCLEGGHFIRVCRNFRRILIRDGAPVEIK